MNLNLHFHMLILEGVYAKRDEPSFIQVPPPTDEEVQELLKKLSMRILRCLTHRGYFEANQECGEMLSDPIAETEPILASCMAASIKYRVALGERAGQRIRRLGTMEECFYEEARLEGSRCASLGTVLMTIDKVGNDLGFGMGTCGKDGQGVPVADAQPTLRIPEITVGGLGSS
jgi:hypothetical protein